LYYYLYIKFHIDCSENNIYNYVLLNKKKIVRKRPKWKKKVKKFE